MKKIYSRFDKQKITELPQVLFPGRIVVVVSENEARKAVKYLLSQDVIGLDTETKPLFKAGRQNEVALLQVSSRDVCFLFRLNYIGMPQCIIQLLSDSTNVKVGLSWHDDLRMLQHRAAFEPGKFVELQDMVQEFGIQDKGLQKLYANIFGEKISKSQRLSNWETDVFTESQKLYAATDAWACVMIYDELLRMKAEGYELEVVPEPEPDVFLSDKNEPKNEAPKKISSKKSSKLIKTNNDKSKTGNPWWRNKAKKTKQDKND